MLLLRNALYAKTRVKSKNSAIFFYYLLNNDDLIAIIYKYYLANAKNLVDSVRISDILLPRGSKEAGSVEIDQ